MTLIDWSDPEEMLGLLLDYVRDEAIASTGDRERVAFLTRLGGELDELSSLTFDEQAQMEAALREIREAQPVEFREDPVMVHVDACIEELRRIAGR